MYTLDSSLGKMDKGHDMATTLGHDVIFTMPLLKPLSFGAAVVIEDIVFGRTEMNGFKSNT